MKNVLVQTRIPVSIRRRHQRPGAGVSAEPGWPAGRADRGACDAKASGYNPYAPRKPHFAPRAKSVISLFMSGGVSHVDTFDPKPALAKYAGQPLTGKGDVVVRQGNPGPLMPSPFQFRKYGQSGMDVSEIFPHARAARGRDGVPALGVREVERPRAGHLRAEYRQDSDGASRASGRG